MGIAGRAFLHFRAGRGAGDRSLTLRLARCNRGRENGRYELTSGTMRYARPTNASGNKKWDNIDGRGREYEQLGPFGRSHVVLAHASRHTNAEKV